MRVPSTLVYPNQELIHRENIKSCKKCRRRLPKSQTRLIFKIIIDMMIFWKRNALFFILMIITQQHLIDIGAMLSIDNDADSMFRKMLTDFFIDLDEHTFKKFDYRQIIVLGKDDGFIESMRSILEMKPHCIGDQVEATIPAPYSNESSLVLAHVDDLSNSNLISIFSKLQGAHSQKLLLVTTGGKLSVNDLEATIKIAEKMNVKNTAFANLDRNSQIMKIYKQIFTTSCRSKFSLTNIWVWKKGFLKFRMVLMDLKSRWNLYGCPIVISTIELPPTMNLKKNEDGSFEMISGIEAGLISNTARILNFVPIVRLPTLNEQWWQAPNGSSYGIVEEVAKGRAHIGIGKIRPTIDRIRHVDMTVPYNLECLGWTVPLMLKYEHNIIISEFSTITWLMIITAFVLICGLVLLIQKIKTGKCRGSWGIVDMISVSLGYAIPRQPNNPLSSFFFLIYLNYSRVIIIAYSSSLASILSTTSPQPIIRNEQGVFDAGLSIAGPQSLLDLAEEISLLKNTTVNSLNRYVTITSTEEALARIEERRDIALIHHRPTVNYLTSKLLREKKEVNFYSLNGCFMSYYSIIVMEKGSQLIQPLNEIILRLSESGIIDHCKNEDDRIDENTNNYESIVGRLVVLKSIFFLYFYCIILSLLSFAAELLIFKLQRKKN